MRAWEPCRRHSLHRVPAGGGLMMTTILGTDSPSFLAVPAQARSRRSGLSGFIPLVGALLCRQCASCVSLHRVESDSSRDCYLFVFLRVLPVEQAQPAMCQVIPIPSPRDAGICERIMPCTHTPAPSCDDDDTCRQAQDTYAARSRRRRSPTHGRLRPRQRRKQQQTHSRPRRPCRDRRRRA